MGDRDNKGIRVAIVGGGMGGLSTALSLLEANEARQRESKPPFSITIYQNGWRLGGKGASGRGLHDRIEEHGLHVWMGFYENAFRLLRRCYEELGQNAAGPTLYRDWRDAFIEEPCVGLHLGTRSKHSAWLAAIPPNEDLPGDPLRSEGNPYRVTHYVQQTFALLRALILSEAIARDAANSSTDRGSATQAGAEGGTTKAGKRSQDSAPGAGNPAALLELAYLADRIFEDLGVEPDDLLKSIKTSIRQSGTLGVGAMRSLLQWLSPLGYLPELPGGNPKVVKFAEDARKAAEKALSRLQDLDPQARRCWQLIDILAAVVRGLATGQPNVFDDPRALDALNEFDFREWVAIHGANEESLSSPFLTGMYNLMFARAGGLAAGQALRGAFRMFLTYRGAFFWKMRSGMGDVVFAPMYRMLRAKGVRFEFFHRLHEVSVHRSADNMPYEAYVDKLVFERQLVAEEYEPLDARGCWPGRPLGREDLTDQQCAELEWGWSESNAEARQVTLKVNQHFDMVVLAVPVDVLRLTARNLASVSRPWQAMLDNVCTTATHGFQWWTSRRLVELGWHHPRTTISAISDGKGVSLPFDTWADMTQVLPTESGWEEKRRPRGVHYFCGPLDIAERTREETDAAFASRLSRARDKSTKDMRMTFSAMKDSVWPALTDSDSVDWFLTVNAAPGQRYVLSEPAKLQYRISPLDMHFDNLTVAGDWTDCGYNAGCIEAAVMSGRLASHALSGFPSLDDIIGYDHP